MSAPLGAAFVTGLSDEQIFALENLAEDYMIEILTQVCNDYVDRMLVAAGEPLTAALDPHDLSGVPESVDAAIRATIVPLVGEVYISGAGALQADMIREANVSVPSVHSIDAVRYLSTMPHVFDEVGQDLWNNMRTTLAAGLEAGDSIPEIATAVRAQAGITARTATLVARSSVVGAANAGSYATATAGFESGIDMAKEWLSTPDARTRPTHKAADAQRADMRAKFVVGGYECDHPGDIVLPPAERYNCFPAGTLVYAANVQRAYRSWFEGELIEVVDSEGQKLSGTPNHPVLTGRGWVGMGSLLESDDLINYRPNSDSMATHHVDAVPAMIEEIFDALAATRDPVRVSSFRVDFHGDRPEGDVDIVTADGQLRLDVETSIDHLVGYFLLPSTDISTTLLPTDGRPDQSFFAADATPDGIMRGDGQAPPIFGGSAGHPCVHGSTTSPSLDSVALQPSGQRTPTDSHLVSEHLLGFAGQISLNKIVGIRRLPFSGHVYNLQTRTGAYCSNGIVVHNCRCTLGYIMPRREVFRGDPRTEALGKTAPARLARARRLPEMDLPSIARELDQPRVQSIQHAADFGTIFEDPGMSLRVADLRKIATDEGLPSLTPKMSKSEMLTELRFLEQATGRQLLPPLRPDQTPPVLRLFPEPDAGEIVGGLYQLRAETGPGGIALRAISDATPGYTVNGRAWRINGVNYVFDLPRGRDLSPREQSYIMTVLDGLQRIHASLPPGASSYNRSYIWAQGRNPADAHWAQKYGMPGFESEATAGRGVVTIWNRKTGRGLRADTIRHETGHNLDNLEAKGNGLGSDSAAWDDAIAADAAITRPAGLISLTGDSLKPPTDLARAVPDGVTPYGQSSLSEDFAESYMLYLDDAVGRIGYDGDRVTFRDLFPNRAAVLDRIVGAPPAPAPGLGEVLPSVRRVEPSIDELIQEMDAWGSATDPAMKLTVTALRALAKREIGQVPAGTKAEIVRQIRGWEQVQKRTVLPPMGPAQVERQLRGDAFVARWAKPDPEVISGDAFDWSRGLEDTGPGGMVVRGYQTKPSLLQPETYDVAHGRAWVIDGTGYLIETSGAVVSAAEQARVLQTLATLHRLHAETPHAADANSSYEVLLGDNPADAAMGKKYKIDGFRSSANAGDGRLLFWGARGGRGIDDHTFQHETGHNVEMKVANKRGLVATSDRWLAAAKADSDYIERIPEIQSDRTGPFRISAQRQPGEAFPDGVTPYGKSYVREDFAEAYDMYVDGQIGRADFGDGLEPVWFRDLFPNRAAEFDSIFPDFAARQLAEIKAARGGRTVGLKRGAKAATKVEVQEQRALREAARDRQRHVDKVSKINNVIGDLDELAMKRADVGHYESVLQQAISERVLSKAEAESIRKALATGDAAKLEAALQRLAKKNRLELGPPAGSQTVMVELGNPAMRPVGSNWPAPGTPVRVVRRSTTATYAKEKINLEPALVREIGGDEIARIRQAAIDDAGKVAGLVADIRREAMAGPVSAARVTALADRANVPASVRSALIKAATDPDALARGLAGVLRTSKIKASGVVGRGVKFDPETMEVRGGVALDPDAKVKIIETGYVGEIDGAPVVLRKAVVEPVAPKAPKPPAAVKVPPAAVEKPVTGAKALKAPPLRMTQPGDKHVFDGFGIFEPAERKKIEAALVQYVRSAFDDVNAWLRTGNLSTTSAFRYSESEVKDFIRQMTRAFNRSRLTEPITVYRGLGTGRGVFGPPDSWPADLAGFEWTDTGMFSTSVSRKVAEEFGQVQLRITVPRNNRALTLSGMNDEAEILLPHGSRFRVTGDRGVDGNGKRVLDVEVLPDGGDVVAAPGAPSLAGLPQLPKPPTQTLAAKAVNPHFGQTATSDSPNYHDAGRAGKRYTPDMGPLPHGAFEENCSNVVYAFEMRMRGFDIEAAPLDVLDKYGYAAGRTYQEMDELLGAGWTLPNGRPHGRSFAGQRWRSFDEIDAEIERDWPEGGRGTIFVGRHIFSVVKTRGKAQYMEGQFDATPSRSVTALYKRKYGSKLSGGEEAKLIRLDDLTPTQAIMVAIRAAGSSA